MDWKFWLALAVAAVGSLYQVLSYYQSKGVLGQGEKSMKRPYIVAGLFMLLTWGAVGLDYLDRHYRAPELTGNLSAVGEVESGPAGQDLGMYISGVVMNPHGPPSALLNWEVRLDFPYPRSIKGEILFPPAKSVVANLFGTRAQIFLLDKDYWPSKTLQPIPVGGAVEGWFAAIFKNVKAEEVYGKNVTLVVSFTDVVTRESHVIKSSELLEKIGIEVPRSIPLPGEAK